MALWLASTRGATYYTKTLMSNTFRSLRTRATAIASKDEGSFTNRQILSNRFVSRRFGSSVARQQSDLFSSDDDEEKIQALDFPGGRVPYTLEMRFLPGSSDKRVECYRVLDDDGYPLSSTPSQHIDKEVAVKMYSGMVTLEAMDTVIYEAQRQGRISFYMTSLGEEAVNLGSAAALSPDDVVLPQ
ncbi:hypothetical protein SSX86_032718, partial [Deinandra increscens subsp. villosa]